MRKRLYVIILAMLLILPFSVSAKEYFEAGETVRKNGEYNHSIFAAGNSVNQNASVNGISFLAGNQVSVKGNGEYYFAAGNLVDVSASSEKDMFVAGNSVKIDSSANIGRDLYAVGNSVNVLANVNSNAFLAGSSVVLDNITINGDLEVDADLLQIEGNVNISGKLVITSTTRIINEQNLKYAQREVVEHSQLTTTNTRNVVVSTIISIGSLIVLGIVLAMVFKKSADNLDLSIEGSKIGKYLLTGLGVLVLVPLIAILILITYVGALVSLVLFLLYAVAIIVAIVLAMSAIGNLLYTKVLKQDHNIYLEIVIGVLVCSLLELIPYVGFIVGLFVLLYGLGMIWDMYKKRND